ncbi:MAG TPA: tRNA (N(6)-L-threonylcarbamoyladenosine(37)-C(2))-methylthiotransferase MtaB [Candidatus Acidoferrales bacterium]|jgi:threonylcarbamoyladenosine tRNA methylthiotransferase MtaB|nr:tRNA (N(6)-L-threonylcarbamoyladenosine(37)-C(2))-methylthiotransferase MtaB [Candidatus Acidoferrales bacterium]
MPTFHIEHFGCRATQADAAAIERQLLDRGYASAGDSGAADVIVINTCTVTVAADAQARGAIRDFTRKNAAARIVVTGCYAQRAAEEVAALPGVAWVVGNSHRTEIPRIVSEMRACGSRSEAADSEARNSALVPLAKLAFPSMANLPQDDIARAKILTGNIFALDEIAVAPVDGGEGGHTRPTLKIQDGCDNRCAYCVIPFVRGRSRSLAPDRVIEEISRLVACGTQEIVLSGINLGSYGRDFTPREEFADLLRRILDETSLARLRISSVEPMDVTQDLIELFASSDRIARHFHIPMQSGSDRILAAMHRRYRAEHYARRAELVREWMPDAAIGADIVAGFPGESDADHRATCDLLEQLPLTYLHVFSFSERPGTAAAGLTGSVPSQIIRERARELRAVGTRKKSAFAAAQMGRPHHVLTLNTEEKENSADRGEWSRAISSNYLDLRVAGRFLPNQWLDVEITSFDGARLRAECADAVSLQK